jgi:PAS domain S-box-containing protein
MSEDSNAASSRPARPAFLNGGGKLGDIIADFDWSATSLGRIARWPEALKATMGMVLRSPVPIVTLWNPDGVMLYNDAYSIFAGGRHPHLLGSKVREGWPEVADFNDNVMKVVLAGGTLAYRDQELTLHRSGAPEQVWMNLDYSPVLDENGEPFGVIAIVVETTAKVRAERWLQGEQERLRRMFEQAPGFMAMVTGPSHVFELANPAYLELTGRRAIVGQSLREALPELAGQGFFELFDRVAASGEVVGGSAEAVSLRRAGDGELELKYTDFVLQPLKNEAGQVVGIFIQGADVTDRVLAEQAVRASEAKFRLLAQAMPNQVWAAPADGHIDWFNDRAYQYSGARLGQLDGDGWLSLVHPDDASATSQRWAAAVAAGVTYETQYRIRRADGRYRWHLSRALPLFGDDGALQRWIGANTDIDDQKAGAEALEHLNTTLAQQVALRTAERDRMWRLSTDIMLVADFDTRIVAANPAMGQLLGWQDEDIVGLPFIALIHPDERDRALAEVAVLKQAPAAFRIELRYRRKDGAYVAMSWTGMSDESYIHAVGRDVSAEREAAAAMRRTELALQQAQKMETIGKLTGGVAHDFNNLLQVISGNLQLLTQDMAGNARAERRLVNAMAGVTRGAKLASYLLAFGRRQALEPKVVKIGRFVAGMEDMLRRSLGEEIEIETIVSGGLWNTFVDTAQVENALLNLSINARDAMDGVGRLTIEVGNAFLDEVYARTHAEVAPGQYVVLAVTDTGSGMTADVLAQAFEPFFSTKPEGKGTGLGLSMVYGFVKQSGGHVKIYSEIGHGTTVKLYLPRTHESEDIATTVENQAVEGGAETILVAEDDEEVRVTVVEMLSELGYQVLKANDAASALTVIESGMRIDLLFTDVVMPGPLRSPDLARKARERLPNLAVLFTSGYTENAIVHGGRLDAGVDLLGKPYTREALAQKIRQVLAAQKQRDRALLAEAPAEGRAPLAPVHAPAVRMPPSSPISLKVLLVEDNAAIRLNTAELLSDLGLAVIEAADAAAALAALETQAVDVLISDLRLPDMPGEQLARLARDLRPSIGIVFATGEHQPIDMPGALVLRKPYDSVVIATALRSLRPGAV